jgi:hypothetical protein
MILDTAKAYISENLVWVKLGAAAIVIAFLAYQWHAHNAAIESKADAAGYARGHAELETYRGQLMVETNRRLAENAVQAATVKATNEASIHELQTTLSDIAANRDSLAERLHHYQGRTSCTAVPQATDQPGTADSTGSTPSIQTPDGLLDAFRDACFRDSARFGILQQQVKTQLAF